jgi:hypothetical protein
MECKECHRKVTVKNIVRIEEEIFCSSCRIPDVFCKKFDSKILEEVDENSFVKGFVYTYALLYKQKMIE